jgi:hypothetical protein
VSRNNHHTLDAMYKRLLCQGIVEGNCQSQTSEVLPGVESNALGDLGSSDSIRGTALLEIGIWITEAPEGFSSSTVSSLGEQDNTSPFTLIFSFLTCA